MTINEKILKSLKDGGTTQKELAAAIGVPYSTLNSWLKLKRDVPSQYLVPICEALGMSIDNLLYGDGTIFHSPAVLNEDQISLLNSAKTLSDDELQKVLEYIKFVKSQRKPE